MTGLLGLSIVSKKALKSSYRDTRSRFSCGGKHHKSHVPLSKAQKAKLAHLRRLAPKPRKKQRRHGNGSSAGYFAGRR